MTLSQNYKNKAKRTGRNSVWHSGEKIVGFFGKKVFSANNQMKHCHLYFTANSLSVESLLLKLCIKMLLANQITGFFKVQYFKKKVKDQVDFLYINRYQKLPTRRYYCFGVGGQACLKYPN